MTRSTIEKDWSQIVADAEKPSQEAKYFDLRQVELPALPEIETERLERLAKVMRGFIFAAVEAAQSGHPGGSSGKVEQFLSLITSGAIGFDALNPKNSGRDRVVWSAGHCSPGLYGGLALVYEVLRRQGRQFSEAVLHSIFPEDLTRFRHPEGPQGHIENYYPFSDVSTGPSGHGLSAAGGMAIAHRSCGLNTKVWVFMGDAESEEGMSYEARNVIAATGTDNLIVSLDYNHFGIDGPIEEVVPSAYLNHWLGMGWNVVEVDGHNFLELSYAYRLASQGFKNNLPTVVLAHTLKGKSYGDKENTAASHGTPAKHDEYIKIMKSLGFDIPGKAGEVAGDIEKVLENLQEEDDRYFAKRLEAAAEKIPSESDLLKTMKTALAGRQFIHPTSIKRPATLPAELTFKRGDKIATRKATQAFFKWLMNQTAFFYAGTGDLSKSILTNSAEDVFGLITPDNPYGRGIRFGIAEQNMAMMSAAMTQDVLPGNFQPISVFSTYAVFTSMMTNCVRLALIGNHQKPQTKGFFIMLAAHDGPETGEDGPTHQGLYWMSMFTAYPGIKVYKPFDAAEAVEMLFYALAKGEPVAFSVTRPDTPVLDRKWGSEAKDAVNGAYVYKNFEKNSQKKLCLVISGSQMLLNTLEVLPDLEKEYDIKIVCVTSPQLFEQLRRDNPQKAQEIFSDQDREGALALHNGWKGFLYPFLLPSDYEKRTIAIDTYLKSGTAKEVYELAGLAPQDLKKRIEKAATGV